MTHEPVLISFTTVNRKLSDAHSDLRGKAITTINEYVSAAKELPIRIPYSVLTDVDCVRIELLRRLEEIGGWKVTYEYADDEGTQKRRDEAARWWREHPEEKKLFTETIERSADCGDKPSHFVLNSPYKSKV